MTSFDVHPWTNPSTRESLIVRLRDPRDHRAWDCFVALYGPLIHRVAQKLGVRDDEAAEIAQDTLIAVARAVDRFDASRGQGTFRGWLARIARNQTLSLLRKRGHTLTCQPIERSNSDGLEDSLKQLVEPSIDDPLEKLFDDEHRRQLFLSAVQVVRPRFQESNWRAFWETAVRGRSVTEVAEEIGLRPAQVYVARSRIIASLKSQVESLSRTES